MTRTTPLTWLYAPASRPDLLAKALKAETDVVIADLEDAVGPHVKVVARRTALNLLDTAASQTHRDEPAGPAVHVRVNPVSCTEGRADLAALAGHPGLDVVRLPKVHTADDIELARELLGGGAAPAIHALIESAAGVENVFAIARARGVAGISLGEADLAAQLDLSAEQGLDWIRGRIVVAAAATHLPPPPMSVYGHLADDAGLAASCRRGRALGLRGRAAIHPRQLPIIRRAFAPDRRELAAAREVLAAVDRRGEDACDAFQLPDGRFVDRAIIARARRTARSIQPSRHDTPETR